jgi:hypothetical protein
MTELKFVPFADDTAAATVAGLTVENGLASLAVYGSLTIRRTEADLENVRYLMALLGDIETAILARPAADGPAPVASVDEIENPF